MMNKFLAKRIVDLGLSITMILLLSFSLTGTRFHEYLGITMLVFVVIHQILNRSFYKGLKARPKNPLRLYLTIIDLLLLLCFIILMLAGLSMSTYVPTLFHGRIHPLIARRLHLGLAYYMMILLGLHLGAHINEKRIEDKKLLAFLKVIAIIPSLIGFWIFISFQGFAHLTFSLAFATMGGSRVFALTVIEVILMCFTFVYLGIIVKNLILSKMIKKKK
jgi:cytochrome b561